jgi:hypothetical protein
MFYMCRAVWARERQFHCGNSSPATHLSYGRLTMTIQENANKQRDGLRWWGVTMDTRLCSSKRTALDAI